MRINYDNSLLVAAAAAAAIVVTGVGVAGFVFVGRSTPCLALPVDWSIRSFLIDGNTLTQRRRSLGRGGRIKACVSLCVGVAVWVACVRRVPVIADVRSAATD